MLNRVTIQGRLTADPKLNQNGQTPITNFTIASDRSFKDKDGNRDTDFIRCTAFSKTAENLANFFQKGQMIIVYGRWQTGSYQDNNGNRVYTNDLIIQGFEFDGSKSQSNQQTQNQQPQQPQQPMYQQPQPDQPSQGGINLDDLPFD